MSHFDCIFLLLPIFLLFRSPKRLVVLLGRSTLPYRPRSLRSVELARRARPRVPSALVVLGLLKETSTWLSRLSLRLAGLVFRKFSSIFLMRASLSKIFLYRLVEVRLLFHSYEHFLLFARVLVSSLTVTTL